jgi:hypothetical protein
MLNIIVAVIEIKAMYRFSRLYIIRLSIKALIIVVHLHDVPG